ncbi:MAG TPA: YciI family protein [Sandaracinaceae bacterium LLY-WYZ-13_1]|nr:YciI family protein [Sandaracinaceae bacterium LLY-WYZ-13_1]
MRYLLMIYDDEQAAAARYEADPGAMDEEMAGYFALDATLRERDQLIAGEALEPTSMATTVRIRDGETITTDGPFAETKEQLGGFYLIEANDLDEACALATRIPAARTGSIEVRPIMPLPDAG